MRCSGVGPRAVGTPRGCAAGLYTLGYTLASVRRQVVHVTGGLSARYRTRREAFGRIGACQSFQHFSVSLSECTSMIIRRHIFLPNTMVRARWSVSMAESSKVASIPPRLAN